MNHSKTICFVLAALAAGSLAAQQQDAAPPRSLLDGLRAPIHRDVDPDGVDRGTWTAGRDWTASLHDGAVFRPCQPADVEPSPWRWRTTAVALGGEPRPLAAPVPRGAGDFRCEYDLGAAVEAYDVRAEGLEQTFVLRHRTGRDVVITGAVTTALRAEPRGPLHAPIDFLPAGRGNGVRYGAAFAVDANGATLPLATAWDGERLRIDVPGQWLAGAAWPVVVDPLLSTIMLDASTAPVTHVAVERDERNAAYGVGYTFERRSSSLTRDFFFLLAPDSLQGAIVVFSRLNQGYDARPQLAFVRGTNKWVLGWDSYDHNSSRDRSALHVHSGADVTPSATSMWAPGATNRRQKSVRIGGNRTSSASSVLVVWESDVLGTSGNAPNTQIHTCLFDTASSTFGSPVHLAGGNVMFPGDCEAPSVSRDRGTGSWMVAWQHMTAVPMRWNVVAQRIGGDGVAAGGVWNTDQVGAAHQLAPVVDGRNGAWCVAFRTVPFGSLTSPAQMGFSLRAQRFLWADSAAGPGALGTSQVLFGPANYPAFRADAVAFDKNTGHHWAVATSQLVFGQTVTALTVVGHDAKVRNNLYPGGSGSDATAVAFDEDAHQFVFGYGDAQNGFRRAMGARWGYPAQPAPSLVGTGCGTAYQTVFGSYLAGAVPVLRLVNANVNVPAVIALSFGTGDVALPAPFGPGCRLWVDAGAPLLGTVAMLTDGAARAELPLALPSTLPALSLHSQWFWVNPNDATFRGTSAMRLDIR
jgi:hypothetical protein